MVVANKVMLMCKVRAKEQGIIALLRPAAIWERMVAQKFKAGCNYGSQSKC